MVAQAQALAKTSGRSLFVADSLSIGKRPQAGGESRGVRRYLRGDSLINLMGDTFNNVLHCNQMMYFSIINSLYPLCCLIPLNF